MIHAGSIGMPLHFGKVPTFLTDRMANMGETIIESIVENYGKSGTHPYVRSELVSGAWSRDGYALEQFRRYNHGARSASWEAQSTCKSRSVHSGSKGKAIQSLNGQISVFRAIMILI